MLADYNESLRELVRALENSEFTYALGGASAVAVWAVPRATADIDITLWGAVEDTRAMLGGLIAMGVDLDADVASKQVEEQGVVYARWRGIRLDIFFPSIPFYEQVRQRRVRLDLPEVGPTWVIDAASLVVFKLLFFRTKDLRDIEAIVELNRDLDRAFIRRWLVQTVGTDDVRIIEWDRIDQAT